MLSQELLEEEDAADETPPVRPPPARRTSQQPPPAPESQRSHSVSSFVAAPDPKVSVPLGSPFQPKDSLSDIVAKDAAQSYALPPPNPTALFLSSM